MCVCVCVAHKYLNKQRIYFLSLVLRIKPKAIMEEATNFISINITECIESCFVVVNTCKIFSILIKSLKDIQTGNSYYCFEELPSLI